MLRAPIAQDAVYVAELANDIDVARMTSQVRHPYRLSDAETFLSVQAQADPQREQVFPIEHPLFGPMGMVGVHSAGDVVPELGYWLGRTFRSRGFATEAARAVVGWARDAWGRRALVAGHFADNPASGRVLEKAGFLYTGEVRPRFSLGRGREVETRMMVWLAWRVSPPPAPRIWRRSRRRAGAAPARA